jgi:hypothetical protein
MQYVLTYYLSLTMCCAQIDEYIQQCLAAKDEVFFGTVDCNAVLLQNPSILELVRNPFVLRLFVDALPGIPAVEWGRVTRYTIYSVFIQRWFAKEVGKMTPERQAALGLVGGTFTTRMDNLLDRFELLSALLAGEMLKVGELATSEFVWKSLRDVAKDWIIAPSLASDTASLDQIIAATEAVQYAVLAIDALQSTCPLRRVGASLQFIHKSFWE